MKTGIDPDNIYGNEPWTEMDIRHLTAAGI
jgi:hypothetical protein